MPRMPKLPPPMRRRARPDINQPVPLPYDATSVTPHERDVARFQAEDARTGMQTDEVTPTVRIAGPPKLSALRNLRFANRRRAVRR
jgi:hypothetical protein